MTPADCLQSQSVTEDDTAISITLISRLDCVDDAVEAHSCGDH